MTNTAYETHCHRCRLLQREENAEIGVVYYQENFNHNDENINNRDISRKAQYELPEVYNPDRKPTPIADDPVCRAANWSYKLYLWARLNWTLQRNDLLRYTIFLPAMIFILHVMDYGATVRGLTNVLICPVEPSP